MDEEIYLSTAIVGEWMGKATAASNMGPLE